MRRTLRRPIGAIGLALVALGLATGSEPDRALAEEPPPVIGPVVPAAPPASPAVAAPPTVVPAAPAPAAGLGPQLSGAPMESTIPPGECTALLPSALAELDYWRSRALAPVALPPPVAPTVVPLTPGIAMPVAALPPVSGGDGTPSSVERPRVEQVAAAIKEMKAKDAALVFAGWDDGLAIAVLARLPPRASGAIAAALPPEHAARLLARLSQLTVPGVRP